MVIEWYMIWLWYDYSYHSINIWYEYIYICIWSDYDRNMIGIWSDYDRYMYDSVWLCIDIVWMCMYYVMIMHGISSLVQIWSRRTFHGTLRHLSASPFGQESLRTTCDMALIFTCILLYVSILFNFIVNLLWFIVIIFWFYCVIILFWNDFENILKCSWYVHDIFWF